MRSGRSPLFVSCLVWGCAQPAPPLSAEAHEEAAGDEDVLAAADDNALEADEERGCGGSMGPPGMTLIGPCWTVQVDARENHRRDADAHRLAAAAHREAADTLREAESRSCSGLSDEDRDESPFAHRADVLSVTPLLEIAATPGDRDGARGPPSSCGRSPGSRWAGFSTASTATSRATRWWATTCPRWRTARWCRAG